jgi:hypothetical protein
MHVLAVELLPSTEGTPSETSTSPRFEHVRFAIDGADLRNLAGEAYEGGQIGLPADVALSSRHLLGEPQPDFTVASKAGVLVCGQCADLYCGMTLVTVQLDGPVVRWSDFANASFDWEADEWRLEPLAIGPFEFDDSAYRRALTAAAG